MKLLDLDPGFISRPAPNEGVRLGVHFLCPKCKKQQLYIPTNDPDARCNWGVSGDLDTLTLTPSVDARHVFGGVDGEPRVECNWHGWIRDGQAVDA